MIQHNPEMMKQLMVLRGDITILVETSTDSIKYNERCLIYVNKDII